MSETCVCCGKEIPEGSMVCFNCSWESAQIKEELTKGELTKELFIHKRKLTAHENYIRKLQDKIKSIEKSLGGVG
jgi:hypothetical protein